MSGHALSPGRLMLCNDGTDQTVDCELVYSPDSVSWERVLPGVPFLPRGPKGSVDAACIYAPAGPPIARDGSLLIVYGGSDTPHRGWKRHCLPCLARLWLDRFAGYEPTDPDRSATVLTRKGGPGTDWVKHFGGQGARVTFAHRSSSSARSSRIELFGGECAQWSFEGLPGPTADWRPVSALLRWDWNDAEAEAAGWRRAPHAFSWRETVRNVGALVVMPALTAGPATFDLADLRIETAVESR